MQHFFLFSFFSPPPPREKERAFNNIERDFSGEKTRIQRFTGGGFPLSNPLPRIVA